MALAIDSSPYYECIAPVHVHDFETTEKLASEVKPTVSSEELSISSIIVYSEL